MSRLVDVRSLAVAFPRDGTWLRVVDDVWLAVEAGEAMGVVGESGCGKTLTALSLVGLVPAPGAIVGGHVEVCGVGVREAPEGELCRLRGAEVGLMFQEPSSALNPVRTVGSQVTEAARLRGGRSRRELEESAAALLAEVGLDNPAEMLRAYPHQLSGGQKQRALLAAALSASPRVLVADEPTSALDSVNQARLVELLAELRARRGLALVFISHDLSLVASLAERITVLYAGETVEVGTAREVFGDPLHPYARALVGAAKMETVPRGSLPTLSGEVPRPGSPAPGCRFAPRCGVAISRCQHARPGLVTRPDGRSVRCFLHADAEAERG